MGVFWLFPATESVSWIMTSSNNERSRVKYQKRLVVVFLNHSWIILEKYRSWNLYKNKILKMLINKKKWKCLVKEHVCIFNDLKAIGIFLQECKNSEMLSLWWNILEIRYIESLYRIFVRNVIRNNGRGQTFWYWLHRI